MTPRSRSEKPTSQKAPWFFEARINSASPARVQVEVIHAGDHLGMVISANRPLKRQKSWKIG